MLSNPSAALHALGLALYGANLCARLFGALISFGYAVIGVSSLAFQIKLPVEIDPNDVNFGDWSDTFLTGWLLIVTLACIVAILTAALTVTYETYLRVEKSRVKNHIRRSEPSKLSKLSTLVSVSRKKMVQHVDAAELGSKESDAISAACSSNLPPAAAIKAHPRRSSSGLTSDELLSSDDLEILRLFSVQSLRRLKSKRRQPMLSQTLALIPRVRHDLSPIFPFAASLLLAECAMSLRR
jgi:hypothetical protein